MHLTICSDPFLQCLCLRCVVCRCVCGRVSRHQNQEHGWRVSHSFSRTGNPLQQLLPLQCPRPFWRQPLPSLPYFIMYKYIFIFLFKCHISVITEAFLCESPLVSCLQDLTTRRLHKKRHYTILKPGTWTRLLNPKNLERHKILMYS